MPPTDRISKRSDLTPDALNEQSLIIAAALAEADPSLSSASTQVPTRQRVVRDPEFPASPPTVEDVEPVERLSSPVAALRERQRPKKKVTIKNDTLGVIVISAISVSVNMSSVGIFMDESFTFEPSMKTQFKLEIDKEKMSVVYAGGFFHFKEERLVMLSFLRFEEGEADSG